MCFLVSCQILQALTDYTSFILTVFLAGISLQENSTLSSAQLFLCRLQSNRATCTGTTILVLFILIYGFVMTIKAKVWHASIFGWEKKYVRHLMKNRMQWDLCSSAGDQPYLKHIALWRRSGCHQRNWELAATASEQYLDFWEALDKHGSKQRQCYDFSMCPHSSEMAKAMW